MEPPKSFTFQCFVTDDSGYSRDVVHRTEARDEETARRYAIEALMQKGWQVRKVNRLTGDLA